MKSTKENTLAKHWDDDETKAIRWIFVFKNADGETSTTESKSFRNPVSLSYAIQYTTQFVRDNYISAQSFDFRIY